MDQPPDITIPNPLAELPIMGVWRNGKRSAFAMHEPGRFCGFDSRHPHFIGSASGLGIVTVILGSQTGLYPPHPVYPDTPSLPSAKAALFTPPQPCSLECREWLVAWVWGAVQLGYKMGHFPFLPSLSPNPQWFYLLLSTINSYYIRIKDLTLTGSRDCLQIMSVFTLPSVYVYVN